jgi:hypothetical protein
VRCWSFPWQRTGVYDEVGAGEASLIRLARKMEIIVLWISFIAKIFAYCTLCVRKAVRIDLITKYFRHEPEASSR